MAVGIIVTTILLILCSVDIVGNSLVCAVIWKNRNLRAPIHILLFNLAVADGVFALLITPKLIVSLNIKHPEGVAGTVLCRVITGGAFAWYAAICAIFTLVAIAFERYFAVHDPHGMKWNLSKRTLKVMITAFWVGAVIVCIPNTIHIKLNDGHCYENFPEEWTNTAYTVWITILVFVALLLMVILYSRVVRTLWFKANIVANPVSSQQTDVLKVRKRVTLMAVIVSVIFGVCWGTIQVLYTLHSFKVFQLSPFVIAISNILVLFNSTINPFVYALLSENFRQKVKGMVGWPKAAVDATTELQHIEVRTATDKSNIPDASTNTTTSVSQE